MMTLFRLLLSGLALLGATQCIAEEVKDSGLVLGEFPQIVWMDNDRVIFLAASGEYCDTRDKPKSYKQPLNRIAVFDTLSGKVEWYGPTGVSGLCYAKGNISYHVRKHDNGLCTEDKWVAWRGRIGDEQIADPVKLDLTTCQPQTEAALAPAWIIEARTAGRRFLPLRAEHGWIELVPVAPWEHSTMAPYYPVRIYPQGGAENEGIIVPDKFSSRLWNNFGLTVRQFESFKGAYLVLAHSGTRPPIPETLWWLYPDGKVEEIISYLRRPDSDWDGVSGWNVMPYKNGIVAFGRDIRTTWPRITTRLFSVRKGNSFEPILDGWMDAFSLSPDGCKLAVGNDPRGLEDGFRRQSKLQVVDLCKGDAK